MRRATSSLLRATLVAATLFLSLFACSENKGNSVKGDVRGVPLLPVTANARPNPGSSSLDLVISSAPDTCTTVHMKSTTSLTLTFPGAAVPPATYAVVDGSLAGAEPGQVTASFREVDAACADLVAASATGGSVVVTAPVVAGGEAGGAPPADADKTIKGTFDLVFGNDHLTGTFDAPLCAAAAATTQEAGSSAAVDAGRLENSNVDSGLDCE